MILNEQGSVLHDLNDRRPRAVTANAREQGRSRTIVIRQGGSAWQSLAFLCLCLLLLALVMMGHFALRGSDARHQEASSSLARAERRIQQLESGMSFDSKRRHLLLGMRNRILRTNPKVSLSDAYYYARLALEACEKYPAVDPLLLLAIGIVESGYDPLATSHADARGLYQIWPSTGRLLVRSLGWNYDDTTLYDPQKNTEAAALYLDILFSTYSDPQMVLAEYNGGPLNAGFFRAGAGALAVETRNYVPRVLELHARLQEEFEKGVDPQSEVSHHRDAQRDGKTLVGNATARIPAAVAGTGPRTAGKREVR
jgi:soluble lytic murein transglycosylase-like protein